MATSQNPSKRGTTQAIADLLPAIRRGEKWAIDEVVTIAYVRLEQLIRGKKAIFAGGIAHRNYRGDEQTGHILSELYERLRRAVEARKFSDLQHPAGFWKIAADHVMYILLDLARDRKKQRDRQSGQQGDKSDDTGQSSRNDDDSHLGGPVSLEVGQGGPGGGGRVAAVSRDDSQLKEEPVLRPSDPIEQIADYRQESAEFYMLRQEVLEAISRLPEPHKTVISMYYYVGATQREISEILLPAEPHLNERKVGRIIDQAEDMLRPLLGEEC